MSTYTIAEHSGLGTLALEQFQVSGTKELAAVRKAGGVVLPGYSVADRVCALMLRYADGAICPSGVVGSFSNVTFRGQRLWIPDDWAQALLRVGDECGWSVPVADLTSVADAIMSPQSAH